MANILSLTTTDHEQVTAAVKAAESQTSAEIVPVVAAASGRYDRAEDLAGLWLGLIFLTITWILVPLPDRGDHGSWEITSENWQLIIYLLAVVAGFLLGAFIASRNWTFRRLLTPRSQMQAEVWQRARALFYDQRIHHTQGASGVLIFLSLYEHQAVILADETIHQKLGQPALDSLCQQLTTQLHANPADIASALSQTIEKLGEQLAAVLPRESHDINELSDALIVLD